jgi:hypothetical protein
MADYFGAPVGAGVYFAAESVLPPQQGFQQLAPGDELPVALGGTKTTGPFPGRDGHPGQPGGDQAVAYLIEVIQRDGVDTRAH